MIKVALPTIGADCAAELFITVGSTAATLVADGCVVDVAQAARNTSTTSTYIHLLYLRNERMDR